MPEDRIAGGGEIVDETCLLRELGANDSSLGSGERRLVVVAGDLGRDAAVQEHLGAARHDAGGGVRVGLPSALHEQDGIDVALGQRSLTGGHLDHGRTVVGAVRRPDRQADAEGREDGEDDQDRRDGTATVGGKRLQRLRPLSPPAQPHRYRTTNSVCMPPRKWPDMLQKSM